jgi:hypothetical protein
LTAKNLEDRRLEEVKAERVKDLNLVSAIVQEPSQNLVLILVIQVRAQDLLILRDQLQLDKVNLEGQLSVHKEVQDRLSVAADFHMEAEMEDLHLEVILVSVEIEEADFQILAEEAQFLIFTFQNL